MQHAMESTTRCFMVQSSQSLFSRPTTLMKLASLAPCWVGSGCWFLSHHTYAQMPLQLTEMIHRYCYTLIQTP
jgi:hypothetical protein